MLGDVGDGDCEDDGGDDDDDDDDDDDYDDDDDGDDESAGDDCLVAMVMDPLTSVIGQIVCSLCHSYHSRASIGCHGYCVIPVLLTAPAL